MKRRVIAMFAAMAFLAGIFSIAPVTNLVPKESQATASAVNVAGVYNWRYSDKHVYVYTERNAGGYKARVNQGTLLIYVNYRFIESIKVPPGCVTVVDTDLATRSVINNTGTTWKLYNLPVRFVGQKVITEVNC